jgi:hypothetical protein
MIACLGYETDWPWFKTSHECSGKDAL